jgi:hypothetical protein
MIIKHNICAFVRVITLVVKSVENILINDNYIEQVCGFMGMKGYFEEQKKKRAGEESQ